MAFSHTTSSIFERCIQSSKNSDLVYGLTEMCNFFGWSNATFFGSGITRNKPNDNVVITTYPNDWISRYSDKNYKYIDPIVLEGSRSLLPLDWSEVTESSPELMTFFGEAEEMGVGKSGLTVSVRGLRGDSSLFSVNSAEQGHKWQQQKNEILSDLTYWAHLFHNIVLKQKNSQCQNKQIRLTRREQDVLRWAARGKTAWETAKILNLSDKTISFYISNANIKLGVATKTQAVARAISERLLVM
jgi:DNA-binding CsgD family transcriptional regulator